MELRACTTGFAKYFLIFLNSLILICAVILIVLSVIYKVHNGGLDIMSVNSCALAVAVLMAVIAFFGCFGAIKGSPCLLFTYGAILLTLFVLQVVVGILALVAIKNGDHQLSHAVSNHLRNLYENYHNNQDIQDEINGIQHNFACCGRSGPSDPLVHDGATALITSCCAKVEAECTTDIAYKKSCIDALTVFVEKFLKVIGIVAIVFSLAELLGAIFSFHIRSTIGREG